MKTSPSEKTFRVPPPQQRDNGAPLQEVEEITSEDDEDLDKLSTAGASSSGLRRRRGRRLSTAATAATSMSIERIASSMFVLGETQDGARARSREPSVSRSRTGPPQTAAAPGGREASLQHLSKEELGGIEYRSLWLLLKIILGE